MVTILETTHHQTCMGGGTGIGAASKRNDLVAIEYPVLHQPCALPVEEWRNERCDDDHREEAGAWHVR
jgi:hypothetical protein